jgi:hypothetical protein
MAARQSHPVIRNLGPHVTACSFTVLEKRHQDVERLDFVRIVIKGRRLRPTRIAVGFSMIPSHMLLLVMLGGDKMGYVILCPPMASVFLQSYDYHYDHLAM